MFYKAWKLGLYIRINAGDVRICIKYKYIYLCCIDKNYVYIMDNRGRQYKALC